MTILPRDHDGCPLTECRRDNLAKRAYARVYPSPPNPHWDDRDDHFRREWIATCAGVASAFVHDDEDNRTERPEADHEH